MLLAVEDALLEALGRRILSKYRPEFKSIDCLGGSGISYLKKKSRELNRVAAAGIPLLLLADLDRPNACPVELIGQWLGTTRHPNFLLRFAVLEAEAWVLADRPRIASLLEVPVSRVPFDVESITQPKEFLLSLARKSKRKRIRDDLVPEPGATSTIGPAYNPVLAEFVMERWRPEVARKQSDSLDRTIKRVMAL